MITDDTKELYGGGSFGIQPALAPKPTAIAPAPAAIPTAVTPVFTPTSLPMPPLLAPVPVAVDYAPADSVHPEQTAQATSTTSAQGLALDDKTGEPVTGVTVTLLDGNGNPVGAGTTLDANSNSFTVWTSDPGHSMLLVQKPGYLDTLVNFRDLEETAQVYMIKGTAGSSAGISPAWLLLLAIPLLQKKKKTVGAIDTKQVIGILIAVAGGYVLLRSMHIIDAVLEFFGLKTSQDTADLDQATGSGTSFWSPNFWQGAPGGHYSHSITEEQAQDVIAQLKDAMGWWNDSESSATAALKQLQTQANLSFVAWEFEKTDGQDLLTWLRGGWWPYDRLSDSEVNDINKYFQTLPKY